MLHDGPPTGRGIQLGPLCRVARSRRGSTLSPARVPGYRFVIRSEVEDNTIPAPIVDRPLCWQPDPVVLDKQADLVLIRLSDDGDHTTSSRGARPCLIAFSTSGCSSRQGTSVDRSSDGTRTFTCSSSSNRTFCMATKWFSRSSSAPSVTSCLSWYSSDALSKSPRCSTILRASRGLLSFRQRSSLAR